MSTRRQVLGGVALAAGASMLLHALGAYAQEYRGPVKVLVGYPPGGPADVIARLVADKLATELGQAVVVENRAGAGGLLAAQQLKVSPADGSVLFLSNMHTVAMLPLINKSAGFATEKDFRTVGSVASFELALAVHPSTEATTVAQLGAWFAANRGRANIGVPAPGSVPELMAVTLGRKFNTQAVPIAYKGAAPLVQDLLSGQIAAGVSGVAEFLQHHQAGKLRILSLTRPTPLLPGVPSFTDAGLPGLELTEVLGLYAPSAMASQVANRYNSALQRVLALPDVRERIRILTMTALPRSPSEHGELVARIQKNMADVVSTTGYAPQQ